MARSTFFLPSFWSAVAWIEIGTTESPGCAIMKSTPTWTVLFVASGDVNTIVSCCTPGGRPVGSTVTTTSSGAPPLALESESQGADFVAVQVSVPLPELVTRNVSVFGRVEPGAAVS